MPDQRSTATRETVFPARYAETDAMGVVHHATYLIYFEEGRSQYMRDMGSDYARVEASGYQLPVTETSIRFLGSLRYGDMVRVRTQLQENRSRRVTFSYEILNGNDDAVLVTGFTRHVWTDADGKVTRVPDSWKQLFGD
ncbi:MAG: thioesterase family protein [Proteobacteria bacterium]|nr:thioesterase family protein [Pseudomonadota bacterium]MDA0927526.1 thioesterase family protein [Pseudomonadota bacterium]